MNAMNKEKVFEDLRNYHTQQFPAEIDDTMVNDLRVEFGEMEDRIIGMILSLVNGKAEFVDSAKELHDFQNRINTAIPDDSEGNTKNIFTSKINQMLSIMDTAKNSGFKLRPIRGFGIPRPRI